MTTDKRLTALRASVTLCLILAGTSCASDPTEPKATAEYQVLFSSTPEGSDDPFLYRVGLDDAPPVPIAGGTAGRFPVASSDGGTIVFNRLDEFGNYTLMILRPGMTAPMDVGGASEFSALQPAVSTDGTRLTFSSTHEDSYGDIYVATLNGSAISDIRRLTTNGGPDLTPRWSPDGQRIAFTSYRSSFPSLWIMTADGLNPTQVTFGGNDFSDYFPSWSSSGSSLVFQRIGSAASRIGIVPSGGGMPTFFDLAGRHYSPAWSPDGAYIAIASDDGDVRILSADGALLKRVERSGVDRSPAWIRRGAAW